MMRVSWLMFEIGVRATSVLQRPRTAAAAETRPGRGRCSRLRPRLPTLRTHPP